MEEGKNLLTIAEAAEMAGLTQAAIRNAVYRERLPAQRIYGRLLIERGVFEKFRQNTKMGRPPKTKEDNQA